MGSIIKRFDRPLSSRKNAPPLQPLKSNPEQDAKSLHESVAATLRMFREDDEKKTQAQLEKELEVRQRLNAPGARIERESRETMLNIFRGLTKSKMNRGSH